MADVTDIALAPLWPDNKVKAERDVEKDCVKWATANGWLSYKFTSPSVRGVVDRVFIRHGVVIWCELKRKGKKPTKLQAKRGRDIQAHGGTWFWSDDVGGFKTYMRGYM